MRKILTRIIVGVGAVGVLLVANPGIRSKPAAVFAQTNSCRLTSLNGPYGFSFNGYFNSGTPVPFTPLAAAGTITFRSDGTLKRDFSLSFGGSLYTVKDSGTYSLNQDCTFTANLPDAGETWNLIPVVGGLQIEFFVNTPDRVGAGTLTRQ